MKGPFRIPDQTRADQARAADPSSSVWVSANAGSGKTHVLAQRVIRLLLRGADPSKILCLTYTRAAAANMSNRVFKTLSAWTLLPDDNLAEEIAALEGEAPTRETIAAARRLFARALETPGGLKIQTIHAFCESILHQFPLEANIASHFELLDPKMEAALIESVRRAMLTGVVGSDHPELTEAFAIVLSQGGESGLDKLLREIVAKRDRLRAFLDQMGGDETRYQQLFEAFGFSSDDTAETIARSVWPLPGFDATNFETFKQVANAADARIVLNNILPDASSAFAEPDPVRRLELLAKGFLKADGEPYDASKTFKKAMHQQLPELAERYAAAAAAIMVAAERLNLFRMLQATCAALDLADWMIGRYEQAKSARGMLDFNDLIVRTLRLLSRQDAGPWVQYKLDKGIDHILLDEAQDTSPDQWEVVKGLAEEFFAGQGARPELRTMFAVGDEKQSIYSFQGAVPESFAETKNHFAMRVRDSEGSFADVRLNWSFRSTQDVLSAVDTVFRDDEARRGLTRDPEPIAHRAIRDAAPGYVEVWPSIGAEQTEKPDDWTQSIDHARAPAVRLAETVAATIERWIKAGEIVEGTGKRVSAGDVLVLVRKRDSFMHALSRSLKNRDIPVAGADRLVLPSHIAIQDLIALGRHLLQPEDDLSLAAILRSPIFGISEEALFDLSADRKRRSLAASLRDKAASNTALTAIVDQLAGWSNEAAFKPVFEFYSTLLARDGVRRKMIGRLGHEVGEVLDEFLNFCLANERTGLPGLEVFLATLEGSGLEVKRELDQTRDEVRIMTVHASKGLEAPIVFLIDSGGASFSNQHMPCLMPVRLEGDLRHVPGFFWYPGKSMENSVTRNIAVRLKDAADDEYRRLLYVGMTRAEDRLVVCGYHGKLPPKPGAWHSIVTRALSAVPEAVSLPHSIEGQTVHRYRLSNPSDAQPMNRAPDEAKPPLPPPPGNLFEPLPRDEKLPRPLTPSGASLLIDRDGVADAVLDRSPVFEPDTEPNFAIARGLATHRLLQTLPNLPEGERDAAAWRYLQRAALDWPEGEAAKTQASVMALLSIPSFAPLFAEGSKAEVAIMGTLDIRGRERVVSGAIDRLAVTDEAVLIVDYKTNRPSPQSLAEVSQSYILQLALYAALLKPLYPGKTISAALLFTETPQLIAVPAEAIDGALARLTGA